MYHSKHLRHSDLRAVRRNKSVLYGMQLSCNFVHCCFLLTTPMWGSHPDFMDDFGRCLAKIFISSWKQKQPRTFGVSSHENDPALVPSEISLSRLFPNSAIFSKKKPEHELYTLVFSALGNSGANGKKTKMTYFHPRRISDKETRCENTAFSLIKQVAFSCTYMRTFNKIFTFQSFSNYENNSTCLAFARIPTYMFIFLTIPVTHSLPDRPR